MESKEGVTGKNTGLWETCACYRPGKSHHRSGNSVSLASRLFGNILGGLVVMELVRELIPVVVPSFLSLYFVLFDGLIQTFIFITLSLAFIGEATE